MARKSRRSRKQRRGNSGGTSRKARHQTTSKLNLEPLDPRILLDASGVISEAIEIAPLTDTTPRNELIGESGSIDQSASPSSKVTSASLRHEFVFVDAGVDGHDQIVQDLQISRPGV